VSAGRALVVFDLDGTLVDSSRDLATALNAALRRLAPATPALPLEIVRSYIGEGARVLVKRSLEYAGLARAAEEVLPAFFEAYQSCLLDTTRLYAGVAEVLDALRVHTLAVLTNKPGDMSRQILDGLGVRDRFLRVYGGGDFPTRKPDPEGLRRLMADADTGAAHTVMVGDSAVDVETGRAAGAHTVGVSYGFDPRSLERSPPDLLLSDLRELPARLPALLGV
jgi:phosphoglycolate phosphatase